MKTLQVAPQVSVRNVLFATDFSACSRAALPYALGLTRHFAAQLYAAHVLSPETYLFGTPENWPELRRPQAQPQAMDAAQFEARLRQLPHQVVQPVGDIADVLFRLVHNYEVDLLVLGTHGRTGLSKLVMGSVAESIFRQSSVPVLTVGPHAGRGQINAGEFDRIVLAIDFSEESRAAVPYAVSLARDQHVHLHVVHVLAQPEAGSVDLEANTSFLLRRLEEWVPPDPELWFQPDYAVEFGKVPEQILKFAAGSRADLILLGVRSPQGEHFTDTTAQHVVAQAGCPVLTVRG